MDAKQLRLGFMGFVDAAIMGPVPSEGIKVLTLASGAHAARFRELLAPYGMNIQVIEGSAGAASAMKLVRSVFMKGLAALLLEMLEAAQRQGIREAVASDIAGWMNARPFEETIKRFVCGTAVHAERRVHEMTDSLELLRSLGSSSRMTRATRAVIAGIAGMGLPARFGGREPDSIVPVLESIANAGVPGDRDAAREEQAATGTDEKK